MIVYANIESKELSKDKRNFLWYLCCAFPSAIVLFFSGYIRGKGFLDGWSGFRAHTIFALYFAYLYIIVGIEKLKFKARE
jgi:hypothetical protein